MNCKPGDLAMVKRGLHGYKHAGKVVEVMDEQWPGRGHGPEWTVMFPHPIELLDGTVSRRAACPDAWLTPIRDPGDDAIDEALLTIRIPELDCA